MKFTYSSGHRVLDGYTLKRGVGRGGFGEVFYALSDGGKEVALKLVRGNNLDMELRGMAQCLNLKHPNLLTLFDIRTDSQGDHWVIMEYISGESLSAVINRHPQGLSTDLARQWFLEMARGITCLHSHGIVHRDLKPGNIFLESGTLKIGDYGLSKFISSSQHTAQTQSVGTVHYMAPEISTGNYNKQVDVYAAGIILYEMLTGRVPFEGESAGEILMKHLTAPPDLSKLPTEYMPIVGKALAKNPAQRYASMAEMAQCVEALGGKIEPAGIHPVATPAAVSQPQVPLHEEPPTLALPASKRTKVGELCSSMVLAALFAALGCTIWMAVMRESKLTDIGAGFFITVASCWAVLVPAKFWNEKEGDSVLRRVVMMILGLGIGLQALWLEYGRASVAPTSSLWKMEGPVKLPASSLGGWQGIPIAASYLSYFGLAFFAMRWWKLADPRRQQRFSFGPILAAGFWAIVLLIVWQQHSQQSQLIPPMPLLLTAAIVQLVSPWSQPPPPTAKRMRLRYT
jgi:hypothetical protein